MVRSLSKVVGDAVRVAVLAWLSRDPEPRAEQETGPAAERATEPGAVR